MELDVISIAQRVKSTETQLTSQEQINAEFQTELTTIKTEQASDKESIQLINREIEGLKFVHENLKKSIQKLRQESALKVDVGNLKKRFETFSDVENLNQYEKVFLPKIRGFEQNIKNWNDQVESMKECIRKFDADMSTKANKSALMLFENRVNSHFVQRTEVETLDSDVSERLDKIDERVDDIIQETACKIESFHEK